MDRYGLGPTEDGELGHQTSYMKGYAFDEKAD